MHTNQVEAGTIKLCFDILSCHLPPPKSCTTSISCSELHAFATEFVEDLLHLIIKHLTPPTMHCNVTAGYKCNSNQRGRNCRGKGRRRIVSLLLCDMRIQ